MPENPITTALINPDQNNYLLEVFLNNTDSSVIITDRNFNITFYNKLAEYSAEQFVRKPLYLGMPLLDLAIPERKEGQLKLFEEILKGNYYENEYSIDLPDGDFVCFNLNYHPAKNNDGEIVGILVSSKNITERKKKEEQLRISDERFHLIIKATSDAVWDYDVQKSHIYFNDSFTRYFGHDPLLWANGYDLWEKHIYHDDRERVIAKITAAINGTETYWEDEYRFLTNDGAIVYVYDRGMIFRDEDGQALRMTGSMQDITERKRKDQALQKAVNDLNKILDSSVDVIVVTDEQNRYVQVSAAAETVWGYKPEELVGKICLHLVHPDDVELTKRTTEKLMRGAKTSNFQNRYIRKDGSVVPLIWSAKWDMHEKVMYSIARDATEKVEAEVALKKSEENYRYLFEKNPLPMFAFDLETFEFVMVNQASVEFYGYSREGFNKITLLDIRPENERDKLKKFIATAKHSTGIKRISGWKHLKKDGAVVEVDTVGHNVMIGGKACRLSVIYDVTERNQARADLQKSEAMFRTISESFPNGIVSILDKDLRFVYVAGKELESLKVSSSYFVGTIYSQHIPDDDLSIKNMSDKVFAGEAMVSEMKFFERNYLVSSVPLYEVDGSIERILVVFQNITTQKSVQKEKELLINELTKNIHDLRQFSYITSHNLRAPISNLIGIMGLIDMNSIKDPDTAFLVEKFKESTFILNETVNDLLNILLIKNNVNVKTEGFSLKQVWQDVCTSVSSQIRNADASIKADFNEVNEIVFNKSYAESILLNLLTNSLKYRHKERQLRINLSTSIEDDFLVLHFCDNGIGINLEHHRDKIFGLYQRFHNYTDSKGLGLYIVHSQITALGGRIEVESEIDKGTCFNIYFKK
jgi:PAS domain S-box-containing protein